MSLRRSTNARSKMIKEVSKSCVDYSDFPQIFVFQWKFKLGTFSNVRCDDLIFNLLKSELKVNIYSISS